MNFLADITTALRLLTILPSGSREGEHPVRFFTWIGCIFSLAALAVASIGVWLGVADNLAALLVGSIVVCIWVLLSGALHIDGLADCADMLGVRGGIDRRLSVMRDSTIGVYAVIAVVLALLAETILIAIVIQSKSWWGLGAAPVLGRMGAALALATRSPARTDGLAATYVGQETLPGYMILFAPVVILAVVSLSAGHILAIVGALVLAVLVPGLFSRWLGGITGDVLGATSVLTEMFVLFICVCSGGMV